MGISIISLSQTGGVATAVTGSANGFYVGQVVTISGATPAAFNGNVTVASIVSSTSFTYAVASGTSSPASGTIAVSATPLVFAAQVNFAGGSDAAQARDAAPGAGDATTDWIYPTYTYDVTDLAGNVLGTNMTPTKRREIYIKYASGGGIGSGYFDESGTFQLFDANERPRTPAGNLGL